MDGRPFDHRDAPGVRDWDISGAPAVVDAKDVWDGVQEQEVVGAAEGATEGVLEACRDVMV